MARREMELFPRAALRKLIEHTLLRRDDEILRLALHRVLHDTRRAADIVGERAHRRPALGMHQHRRARIRRARRLDIRLRQPHMRRTAAAPADHLPPRLLLRERAEIPIRQENDLPILGDRRHHRRRVRRRAADIRHRLHRRRRIHIRHEHRIGMRRARAPHLIRQRIREHPARRVRRRQQRHLLRRKDIRRLRHEPYPAEHDHLGIRPRRLPRQAERIPREIRDLLDLLRLIKMRQNHRFPLPLQTLDFLYDIFHTILPCHTPPRQDAAAPSCQDS